MNCRVISHFSMRSLIVIASRFEPVFIRFFTRQRPSLAPAYCFSSVFLTRRPAFEASRRWKRYLATYLKPLWQLGFTRTTPSICDFVYQWFNRRWFRKALDSVFRSQPLRRGLGGANPSFDNSRHLMGEPILLRNSETISRQYLEETQPA